MTGLGVSSFLREIECCRVTSRILLTSSSSASSNGGGKSAEFAADEAEDDEEEEEENRFEAGNAIERRSERASIVDDMEPEVRPYVRI